LGVPEFRSRRSVAAEAAPLAQIPLEAPRGLEGPQKGIPMSKLDGKVAVVTGGNSGIGLATAKRFVDDGAYVFVTGRRKPELDAAVAELGRNATAVQGDVTKMADLDRLFDTVRKAKGRIDVLFANAGYASPARLDEITEEQYEHHFDINVKGVLFTVQKALPLMRSGASIILNGSIVASKGFPNLSLYSATKGAVRSFARTWTTDLKERRIRVNVVSPGVIDTPGIRQLDAAASQPFLGMSPALFPLGVPGRPEQIAAAVSFLASDDANYITGIELFVDGGFCQI
jgi:NAD(P)-dependent dehydrogenase (short-subunit alcohol dehydrogenase family)